MPKKNNKKAHKKKDLGKEEVEAKSQENEECEGHIASNEVNEAQNINSEEKGDEEAPSLAENAASSKSNENDDDTKEFEENPSYVTISGSNPVNMSINKEDVFENTLSATSSASPPKTKKRLTLLERLALAAKGKKQRSTTPTPTPSAGATPPVGDAEDSKNENIKSDADVHARSSTESLNPNEKESAELTKEPKENAHDKNSDELMQVRQELDKLKTNNYELVEENRRLKTQMQSKPVNNNKEISLLNAQLASKDETIEQLMKEGQALSVKELKLNESIKRLKASNHDLEQSLDDYSKKNEQILLQFNEQEDFLKKHKFKSIQQLNDSYNIMSKKLAQTEENLEKERKQDWEGKYREQVRLFETEASDKKQALKKLNELNIQFDMSRKQNSLELDSKDSIIIDLKDRINKIRDENTQEIYRLENKVESLRMENERSVGNPNGTNDYRSDYKERDTVLNSKQIDYDEFVKLSNNHHNLQQQYLSSQENWKLIESNLLKKVETLNSNVDSLKKLKTKLTNDILKIQNNLQKKVEEYSRLRDSFDELKSEKDEIVFQSQVKDSDYHELQEKFDKFQQIYNTDRQNLNSKIKQLSESLEKHKNNGTYEGLYDNITPTKTSMNGLHLNLEPPKFTKNHSFTSVNESNISYNNAGWPDIRFGESSTTPAISRDYSAVFMNPSHNNSLNSLIETDEMGRELATDSYSYNSKFPSNAGNGSISGIIPTSGNNNIQLINKMSSNIRRLEIELNTMREENTQLSLEKEQAQQEILKHFKLSEEVISLKGQIETLQAEIDSKSKQEETMLELIGEKSEQVEELRADVQDLKDLCKSQVQQMIELQELK